MVVRRHSTHDYLRQGTTVLYKSLEPCYLRHHFKVC